MLLLCSSVYVRCPTESPIRFGLRPPRFIELSASRKCISHSMMFVNCVSAQCAMPEMRGHQGRASPAKGRNGIYVLRLVWPRVIQYRSTVNAGDSSINEPNEHTSDITQQIVRTKVMKFQAHMDIGSYSYMRWGLIKVDILDWYIVLIELPSRWTYYDTKCPTIIILCMIGHAEDFFMYN